MNNRLMFVSFSLFFSLLTRFVYLNYFVGSGIYEYMGIRANSNPWYVIFLSILFSIIPAFTIQLKMERPSQVLVLFIYFTVHIQSSILVPIVSYSSYLSQLIFLIFLTIAQVSLDLRLLFPLIQFKQVIIQRKYFWICFNLVIVFCFLFLLIKSTPNLSSFSLIEVYQQRSELLERSKSIGLLFFYISNWLGSVFIPFLLIVSLIKKSYPTVSLVLVIGLLNFSLSSNKSNYMNLLLVIWGFLLFYKFKKISFSNSMAASFILIILFLSLLDVVNAFFVNENYHFFSWLFFHRIFTNNGYLSAIYLDLMQTIDFEFYQNSFLNWLKLSNQEPIAVLAGKSFTDVEGVHANANIWADAYANLGYLGIGVSALFLGFLLHIYDSFSKGKSFVITVLLLLVQASVVANSPIYSAILSNGFLILLVLVAFMNKKIMDIDDSFLQKRK